MDYSLIKKISDIYGDSFYVFQRDVLRKNYFEMSRAFASIYSNTVIGYSFKTNYTPAICRELLALGCYAEVVSAMEVDLALKLNPSSPNIIFNGPCKTYESIKSVLNVGGIVNLDSLNDFKLAKEVVDAENIDNARLGLRCNFLMKDSDSTYFPDSRFGIDVNSHDFKDIVYALSKSKNMSLISLHCHLPYRSLDSFRERVKNIFELVERFDLNQLEFLNFGGGMYGPMPKELAVQMEGTIPNYFDYAEVIGQAMAKKFSPEDGPGIIIEPGTALVADVFDFYTQIVSTKKIRKTNVAIVSGSIFDIATNSRSTALPYEVLEKPIQKSPDDEEKWKIVGYTCIESDILTARHDGILHIGDFIQYKNVGSYSIVMRPPFIKPSFAIIEIEGQQIKCIKKQQSFNTVFNDFSFDA
ncbi:decarboxylase [Gammaproteobacteria bacterium]|nr:decarboxylase [Gammaproteobacteria bacterium]